MADDFLDLLSDQRAFHPTDPAHGLQNYDIGALTKDQRRNLNGMKMTQRRDNEKYLNSHPEIRGLISILLRHVLRRKPTIHLHEATGSFFARPRCKIAEELLRYLLDSGCTGKVIDDLRKEIVEVEDKNSSDTESHEICICD